MNLKKQICYNGRYYPEDTPLFTVSNRALRYGDSLFETIHAYGTDLQFFPEHFERLTKGMDALGMIHGNSFNQETIEKQAVHLLNKNKYFKGVKVRLSVFRNNGGLYKPSDNSISYLIETTPLEHEKYVLNSKGLTIGIYEDVKKPANSLSQFKTGNSLTFILSGIYSEKHSFDDCLIVNEQDNLAEAISSNLFLVKDNVIITPPLDSGCVAGIMRQKVIDAAFKLNLILRDDCDIKPEYLLKADEIFLTNAVSGIIWVSGYKDRRYFNRTAKVLNNELNRIAFEND